MSVYRKESNSLVPKAGLGIIDNIFNRFSNHAISNAKTTEALILRNVMYDESDGKLYKVGIDGTKGDEIKMGMPSLDYANYLHVFSTSAPSGMPSGASYGLTFTATKDCYLLGYVNSPSDDNAFTTIKINNIQLYAVEGYHEYVNARNQIGIIPCTKLTSGDTVVVSSAQSTLFIFAEK